MPDNPRYPRNSAEAQAWLNDYYRRMAVSREVVGGLPERGTVVTEAQGNPIPSEIRAGAVPTPNQEQFTAISRGLFGASQINWASGTGRVTTFRASEMYHPVQNEVEMARNVNTLPIQGFETTVSDWYGKKSYQKDRAECVVGIELENETQTEFRIPNVTGWKYHLEGSLRNFGYEFVQSPPLPLKETEKALTLILSELKTARDGRANSNSSRTSTHVHFDVTKFTFLEVVNFCILYWILEEFLSHFCGENRKGNLFCLRAKDASVSQTFLSDAIRRREPWSFSLLNNEYRYGSLNLASIPKFGSLEFRMMRGTDFQDDIMTWVNALNQIRLFSLNFKTPLDIKEFFLNKTEAKTFAKTILGEELFSKFNSYRKSTEKLSDEIRRGFVNIYQIFTSHQTFNFEEEVKKAVKRQEEQKEKEKKQHEEFMRTQNLRAAITTPQSGMEDEALDTIEVPESSLQTPQQGDF